MGSSACAARRMWQLVEPVHAVTYFAPEARAAFEQAGLRGFWRGYFAGRAAPLGAVSAPPVVATFFSFSPAMVERAVPAVWQLITPEAALDVRSAGAVAALRRLLAATGPDCTGGDCGTTVAEAADLLLAAAAATTAAGRALGASNRALPVPGEALARLWLAATVVREHRGDGHVAALTAAGLDSCEALVLRAGVGLATGRAPAGTAGPALSRELLQPIRGWTDEEWEAAAERLAERGWIGGDGSATPEGASAHQAVEAATDVAAERPWHELGPDMTDELARLLAPIARRAATALPFPNPVGMPAPGSAQSGS